MTKIFKGRNPYEDLSHRAVPISDLIDRLYNQMSEAERELGLQKAHDLVDNEDLATTAAILIAARAIVWAQRDEDARRLREKLKSEIKKVENEKSNGRP